MKKLAAVLEDERVMLKVIKLLSNLHKDDDDV
jgi:hypothetical protein